MNSRVESKHLFNENVSPHIKSLILKKRAGMKLNDREIKKLENFNSEVVSMVTPTKYHNRMNPIKKPMDDIEDEDIDLDEILREMGYYDEDEQEEMELGDADEDDIREYVREIIRNDFLSYIEEKE